MQSDRSQHSRRSPDRNARERLNAVDACPVFPVLSFPYSCFGRRFGIPHLGNQPRIAPPKPQAARGMTV